MRNTGRALVAASAVLAAAHVAPRNTGRALVAASAVLAAAHAAPATRRWPGSWFFPRILRVRADNGVALTFDDGPDRGLDAFLALMEEARARATFFVAGEQVERDPSKLREIGRASCRERV